MGRRHPVCAGDPSGRFAERSRGILLRGLRGGDIVLSGDGGRPDRGEIPREVRGAVPFRRAADPRRHPPRKPPRLPVDRDPSRGLVRPADGGFDGVHHQRDQPDRRHRRPCLGVERRRLCVLRGDLLPQRTAPVRGAVVCDAGRAGPVLLLQCVRRREEAQQDLHGGHGRLDRGPHPERAEPTDQPDGGCRRRFEHGGGCIRPAADTVLGRDPRVFPPPSGAPQSVPAGQVPHPPQTAGAGVEPARGDAVDRGDGAGPYGRELLAEPLRRPYPPVHPRPRLLDLQQHDPDPRDQEAESYGLNFIPKNF